MLILSFLLPAAVAAVFFVGGCGYMLRRGRRRGLSFGATRAFDFGRHLAETGNVSGARAAFQVSALLLHEFLQSKPEFVRRLVLSGTPAEILVQLRSLGLDCR